MKKTLSIIIPVYNETKRLPLTFAALQKGRIYRDFKLEKIIFVNDGSTDKTLDTLKATLPYFQKKLRKKYPKVTMQIISYRRNRGKGYAIQQGMLASRSDYALMSDADFSTPLEQINKFIKPVQRGYDIVIGTRKNGRAKVTKHQPLMRELLGKVFTKMTTTFLGLSITDYTCGFKLFSQEAILNIFTHTKINGWAYDAEALFLATRLKFSIREVAVVWANDPNTKVKLHKAIPQTLKELAQIQYFHTIAPVFTSVKALYASA